MFIGQAIQTEGRTKIGQRELFFDKLFTFQEFTKNANDILYLHSLFTLQILESYKLIFLSAHQLQTLQEVK